MSAQWESPASVTAAPQWRFTLTKRAIQVAHFRFISRLLTVAILGLPSLSSFTLTQTFHPIPDSRAKTQNEIGLGHSISTTMGSRLLQKLEVSPFSVLRSGVPKYFGKNSVGPWVPQMAPPASTSPQGECQVHWFRHSTGRLLGGSSYWKVFKRGLVSLLMTNQILSLCIYFFLSLFLSQKRDKKGSLLLDSGVVFGASYSDKARLKLNSIICYFDIKTCPKFFL